MTGRLTSAEMDLVFAKRNTRVFAVLDPGKLRWTLTIFRVDVLRAHGGVPRLDFIPTRQELALLLAQQRAAVVLTKNIGAGVNRRAGVFKLGQHMVRSRRAARVLVEPPRRQILDPALAGIHYELRRHVRARNMRKRLGICFNWETRAWKRRVMIGKQREADFFARDVALALRIGEAVVSEGRDVRWALERIPGEGRRAWLGGQGEEAVEGEAAVDVSEAYLAETVTKDKHFMQQLRATRPLIKTLTASPAGDLRAWKKSEKFLVIVGDGRWSGSRGGGTELPHDDLRRGLQRHRGLDYVEAEEHATSQGDPFQFCGIGAAKVWTQPTATFPILADEFDRLQTRLKEKIELLLHKPAPDGMVHAKIPVTLLHPKLRPRKGKVAGTLRLCFPVSDGSENHIVHYFVQRDILATLNLAIVGLHSLAGKKRPPYLERGTSRDSFRRFALRIGRHLNLRPPAPVSVPPAPAPVPPAPATATGSDSAAQSATTADAGDGDADVAGGGTPFAWAFAEDRIWEPVAREPPIFHPNTKHQERRRGFKETLPHTYGDPGRDRRAELLPRVEHWITQLTQQQPQPRTLTGVRRRPPQSPETAPRRRRPRREGQPMD